MLYSLRAGLHRIIRKGGTNLAKFEFKPEECRGILEPLEEIETWHELENELVVNNENEKLRRNAQIICKHFANIQKLF